MFLKTKADRQLELEKQMKKRKFLKNFMAGNNDRSKTYNTQLDAYVDTQVDNDEEQSNIIDGNQINNDKRKKNRD